MDGFYVFYQVGINRMIVTEGCYGGSTFCVYVCSRIDNSVL